MAKLCSRESSGQATTNRLRLNGGWLRRGEIGVTFSPKRSALVVMTAPKILRDDTAEDLVASLSCIALRPTGCVCLSAHDIASAGEAVER